MIPLLALFVALAPPPQERPRAARIHVESYVLDVELAPGVAPAATTGLIPGR